MIWQFGELGYDVSIDNPCRVCEKPILWNYFQNEERKKLYKTYQALLTLRNENEVFRSPDTEVELWLNHASGLKHITLTHPSMDVFIPGNFGVTEKSDQWQFLPGTEPGTIIFPETALKCFFLHKLSS